MKWEFHFEGGPNDGTVWTYDKAPTLQAGLNVDGATYLLEEQLECCCTRYANYLYVDQGANDVS
jgi:hypothetical protein